MRSTTVFAIVVALLSPGVAPAVEATGAGRASNDDVYVLALGSALEERAKAYAHLGGEDYYNVVVVEDVDLTKRVPASLGGFAISVLDEEGLKAHFKQVGRFPLLKLRPLRSEGDRLSVGITKYWFTYRRGHGFRGERLEYALEGGVRVFLRYDCEKRRFSVEGVELWGI